MKKISAAKSPAFYFLTLALFFFTAAGAQSLDPSLFNALHWRMIGPFRGGRTVGAAGVTQKPNVFYIGVNNGGVWKTTDYGRTWSPLFDQESTGSIGAISVAASNPDIVYVGSGEGLHRPDLSTGNGLYKSTDAGKTWTHLGLEEGEQIPKIAIDPQNPDRLFVAVLGHPYGPNKERGIYRSADGGKTFEKVLYVDENTGGDDVAIDPADPNTIFATLWQAQEGPWENAAWDGTRGGIYKSTDGGATWQKLTKGLPDSLVQAHIAIAPANPKIVYAAIATTEENDYGTGKGMGIYRSDNGGESWQKVTTDGRPEARIGGGDVPEMAVDPKNPDIVYSTSIVLWRSKDGGHTWTGIRGAPGGDDYQNIWINPANPKILLVTGDQGAIVSVNGGDTWSSWYNQPTAQLYHVNADNAFPYNVYSGQQESGSVGIASRGNDGQITFREWHPVGAQEYGYAVPDPLNANIIYGGKITRYDKSTGQVQDISPRPAGRQSFRFVRTAPIVFSPIDPKTLYYAGNLLFKTRDGGNSWQVISPDLSRPAGWDIPSSVGDYKGEVTANKSRRGVIYTIAPSPKDIHTIWAGTDDGLIQVTRDDGKTWKNVTPPAITAWSKISIMDAGHFDVNTAYAAVNRIRCDDMHPYIYRTHDGGRTWQKIVRGLPDDPINVVREDPRQKGLLFAGSETAVYVSFDDGDHWQSLRLNMPCSSIRDLILKNDDIVVATHGRAFWILDDITPLRQLVGSPAKKVILFKPQTAIRVRWDMNTDTPLPPGEPGGENPPDGAIIDYYLGDSATVPITLEIRDAAGRLVRRYSSADPLYNIPPVNVPLYWWRPQQVLSAAAGSHRFVWDLHYTPLNPGRSYSMAAIYKNTEPAATSPWAMPGEYTVTLTADGKTIARHFRLVMDPRVKTPLAQLQLQHDYSLNCYEGRKTIQSLQDTLGKLQKQADERETAAGSSLKEDLQQLKQAITKWEDAPASGGGLRALAAECSSVFGLLEGSDMPPTRQALGAAQKTKAGLQQLPNARAAFAKQLAAVNKKLQENNLPQIE